MNDAFVQLRLVAASQSGVVSAQQCRTAGLSAQQVRALCRDRRWLRLNEGTYLVDADGLDGPSRAAVIRGAALSAGPHAVVVLRTAAEVLGLAGLPPEDAVHVNLPGALARPRRLGDPSLALHQLVLRPDDVTRVDGLAVTTPVRTVADLLLRVDRLTGVALLDSCLHRRVLVAEELDLVAALLAGRRGATRCRAWLAEADERAASPLETRVRLRAADGGFAPDALKHPVRARGGVVAIGDLAWLQGGRVIGEAGPTATEAHERRRRALATAGYELARFTWADTLDPVTVPQRVATALVRSDRYLGGA